MGDDSQWEMAEPWPAWRRPRGLQCQTLGSGNAVGGGAALRDERMWLENGSSGKWNSMKTM